MSISGCAGATGDLWDGLHAAAVDALGQSVQSSAHDVDASMPAPESQQSDMDVDASMSMVCQTGAWQRSTDAAWSAALAGRGVTQAVEHPQPHALAMLAAVRCTNMRTCHIGLASSADAANQGAHRRVTLRPMKCSTHASLLSSC